MTTSVRDFKAKLSRYLKKAASGEEVVVTSRGRPVARLVCAARSGEEKTSEAEIWRRIAAMPNVVMPTGPKPRGSKHPIRIRKGEKTLSEIVLEDRR